MLLQIMHHYKWGVPREAWLRMYLKVTFKEIKLTYITRRFIFNSLLMAKDDIYNLNLKNCKLEFCTMQLYYAFF